MLVPVFTHRINTVPTSGAADIRCSSADSPGHTWSCSIPAGGHLVFAAAGAGAGAGTASGVFNSSWSLFAVRASQGPKEPAKVDHAFGRHTMRVLHWDGLF